MDNIWLKLGLGHLFGQTLDWYWTIIGLNIHTLSNQPLYKSTQVFTNYKSKLWTKSGHGYALDKWTLINFFRPSNSLSILFVLQIFDWIMGIIFEKDWIFRSWTDGTEDWKRLQAEIFLGLWVQCGGLRTGPVCDHTTSCTLHVVLLKV